MGNGIPPSRITCQTYSIAVFRPAGSPATSDALFNGPSLKCTRPVQATLRPEISMAKEYIEQRNGAYYVLGTRVSLDSVVCAFLRGESAERIAESFPALGLEQVYGAIAFHLGKRPTIDAYLEAGKGDFDIAQFGEVGQP